MREQARVLRQAGVSAFAELAVLYTWRTWTFTWLARLLIQVSFFGLIGRMLGGDEQIRYLLIGNALAIAALESSVAILAVHDERRSGTLPLLIAAPAGHLVVYLGRGLHYLASGVVTSSAAFFLLPPLFGIDLPWPRTALAVVAIVVVALSAYCYAGFLAAVVLGWPSQMWVVLNLSYLVLMSFCGVNVPVDFWPGWIQQLTALLPLTHGLAGVRELIDTGSVASFARGLALEAVVAAGWLAAAAAMFQVMVVRGRSTGSIEYGS